MSEHLRQLAAVGFVLAEDRGTSRLYRINEDCVTHFPTAADLVMGHPSPVLRPLAAVTTGPDRMRIEPMRAEHAAAVLAIYQAGIDEGDATFETRAPGWDEFTAARLPGHRLVAGPAARSSGGSPPVPCPAAACTRGWSSTRSTCTRRPAGRHGRQLLDALIGSTEAAGIWTIQSGIFPENTASAALHRAAGFRTVGTRERIGQHHGRWRDVVLIERRSPHHLTRGPRRRARAGARDLRTAGGGTAGAPRPRAPSRR